ncbi:MAG: O-antigen ligase family protein [Pseudomonadales bacterium]|nr:O-antigen ligase family protein [Pseudomonadales bacterium]
MFLIITLAVVERPDMPNALLGISGLNPWNLMLISTLLAFTFTRREFAPRLKSGILTLVLFYGVVVLVAFLREIGDLEGIYEYAELASLRAPTRKSIILDDAFNTFKYLVPGILIYFGCSSYFRLKEALAALMLLNVMLGLLVVKSMGFDAAGSGDELEQTAIRRIDRDVGYHRSDLAILLAGGSWALFNYARMFKSKILFYLILASSGVCGLAIGLTGGRSGMAIWAMLALFFGITRYRFILLVGPLLCAALVATVPAVQERFLQGIVYSEEENKHSRRAAQKGLEGGEVDVSSVTSGRTVIWPHVIEKIADAPFIGYGRRAMQRIGLSSQLLSEQGERFPHPHNAYLELLLDNGFVLALPVLAFFIIVIQMSVTLMFDRALPIYMIVGAITLSFVLSFLMGAVAQQSFYPKVSSVSMWVSIALMLRVSMERKLLEQQPDKKNSTAIDTGYKRSKSLLNKQRQISWLKSPVDKINRDS